MFLLYIDEFGHVGRWEPTNPRYRHHPLFGLAGIAAEGQRWKDLDRGFLRLKLAFYKNEVKRYETLHGTRAERFEPKQLRSRRDKRFVSEVLQLVRRCHGTLFAFGCTKVPGVGSHDQRALYTTTVQGILRQFEKFLRQSGGRAQGQGVIIMDRRTESLNEIVLASAQSYLFAAPGLPSPFTRIIETPLLVPSEWYHGVQLADAIGRALALVYRWRNLRDPAYQWAEQRFGGDIDALKARYGNWSTVHVRRSQ